MSARRSEATRSNTKASIISTTSSNDPHKSQLDNYQPIIYGSDTILGINYVDKELECQICLCALTAPTLLPCGAHSICLSCMASFFKHLKKEQFGKRLVYCPSCGVNSGQAKVSKFDDLKVNKELERVYRAYERERTMWVDEKMKLETQLNCISRIKEEEKVQKKKEAAKKRSKGALSEHEEEMIKDMLERLGAEKLKKISMMSSDGVEMVEKSQVTPLKKKGKGKDEVTPKRRAMVKIACLDSEDEDEIVAKTMIKRRNVVTVGELDKKEYPLRNLKKTKV